MREYDDISAALCELTEETTDEDGKLRNGCNDAPIPRFYKIIAQEPGALSELI